MRANLVKMSNVSDNYRVLLREEHVLCTKCKMLVYQHTSDSPCVTVSHVCATQWFSSGICGEIHFQKISHEKFVDINIWFRDASLPGLSTASAKCDNREGTTHYNVLDKVIRVCFDVVSSLIASRQLVLKECGFLKD